METVELLTIAVKSAKEAGRRLLAGNGDMRRVSMQDRKDVKLKADTDSETLIRERLTETGLPIVGEEEGGDERLPDGDKLYWVVDPLDGTYNYLRGLPVSCVSIGLMRGEVPELGVIYDFNRDECFTAGQGCGLRLNGAELKPQWAETIDQASIHCGLPTYMELSDENMRRFVHNVRRFKKVRMIGSAALALAYVACGRIDVYYEQTIRLWDVAAGLALVNAIGGSVRMIRRDSPSFAYDVWASGRHDFIEMSE